MVACPNCALWLLRGNRCELHLVPHLSPLQLQRLSVKSLRRGPCFVPRGAAELSPGFQPWESSTNSDAPSQGVTSVAPCWKNTGCAGLEVLKGRQIERPNQAETGSDGPMVACPNCALWLLRGQQRRASSGTRISRPFSFRGCRSKSLRRGPCFVPRRGCRTQPRVSTLGIVHQQRRALTRRYLVAPVENTVLLKGRQIERPNQAEAGSDGPMVARPDCALWLLRSKRRELHLVSASLALQLGRMLVLSVPRVETLSSTRLKPWAGFCSPCEASTRSLDRAKPIPVSETTPQNIEPEARFRFSFCNSCNS